jgi:hypothetical protein
MPNEERPEPRYASGGVFRRGQLPAVVVAVVVAALVVAGIVVTRSDDQLSPPTSTAFGHGSATTPTPTTIASRDEIVARLREILEVRDSALLARNAALLSNIYTVDCKCLEDGRALIRQLRKEGVVWKGVRTTVSVKNIEEVNDRLWIVVATVTTPSVRIETESGRLVRVVPPERNLVRFGLAKPQNEEEWLLGHASTFN